MAFKTTRQLQEESNRKLEIFLKAYPDAQYTTAPFGFSNIYSGGWVTYIENEDGSEKPLGMWQRWDDETWELF